MFLFISYFSTQEFSLVVAFSYSDLHIVFIVHSIQAGVIHRLAVQPGEKKCTVDIGFRHANITHFSEKRIIHFIHLRRSQGGCLPTRLAVQRRRMNENIWFLRNNGPDTYQTRHVKVFLCRTYQCRPTCKNGFFTSYASVAPLVRQPTCRNENIWFLSNDGADT